MKLRDYQLKAVKAVLDAFNQQKCFSIMLQLATGAGKTVIFSSLCETLLALSQFQTRFLVIVHRDELVRQTYNTLKNFKISTTVLKSGWDYNDECDVVITTRQTFCKRNTKQFQRLPNFIIVDEAHTAACLQTIKSLNSFAKTPYKLLGVSATPMRADGINLDGIFQKLIQASEVGATITELRRQGFLSEYVLKGEELVSESLKRHIEESKKTLQVKENNTLPSAAQIIADKIVSSIWEEPSHRKDLITKWLEHCRYKPTLVYAPSRKIGALFEKDFLSHGINAKFVDCHTSKRERRLAIEQFRDNQLTVLINVGLFTEGLDAPNTEAIVIARRSTSTALKFQIVGRGFRIYPGKSFVQILDFVGQWEGKIDDASKKLNWESGFQGHPSAKLLTFYCQDCKTIHLKNKETLINQRLATEIEVPKTEIKVPEPKTQRIKDELYIFTPKSYVTQYPCDCCKELIAKEFSAIEKKKVEEEKSSLEEESRRFNKPKTILVTLYDSRIETAMYFEFKDYVDNLIQESTRQLSSKTWVCHKFKEDLLNNKLDHLIPIIGINEITYLCHQLNFSANIISQLYEEYQEYLHLKANQERKVS